MDKDLREFVEGKTNVLINPAIDKIVRDKLNGQLDYYSVYFAGYQEPYPNNLCHNKAIGRIRVSEQPKGERKHTGGRRPYVMLMMDKLREMEQQNDRTYDIDLVISSIVLGIVTGKQIGRAHV